MKPSDRDIAPDHSTRSVTGPGDKQESWLHKHGGSLIVCATIMGTAIVSGIVAFAWYCFIVLMEVKAQTETLEVQVNEIEQEQDRFDKRINFLEQGRSNTE
ncbi:MAG: hypothetical protein F4W92_06175 [Gammaproteobacteria bacterium]|nr:hypothetical protein [Gammaproteobacteria bacterium]